jgi:hypothetical protein
MRIHIQIRSDKYKEEVIEKIQKSLETITKEPVVVRIKVSNTNQSN